VGEPQHGRGRDFSVRAAAGVTAPIRWGGLTPRFELFQESSQTSATAPNKLIRASASPSRVMIPLHLTRGAGSGVPPGLRGRQGELKYRTARFIRLCPHPGSQKTLMTWSRLTPAVSVLIVRLQDANKIGHAGSIPIIGHNRDLGSGRGLAPLPNPE
jgi:hypothetical protein